jgi:hypothetical protein
LERSRQLIYRLDGFCFLPLLASAIVFTEDPEDFVLLSQCSGDQYQGGNGKVASIGFEMRGGMVCGADGPIAIIDLVWRHRPTGWLLPEPLKVVLARSASV